MMRGLIVVTPFTRDKLLMKTARILCMVLAGMLLSSCMTSKRSQRGSADQAESRVVVVIVPITTSENDSPKTDSPSFDFAVDRRTRGTQTSSAAPGEQKASVKRSAAYRGGT